MGKLMRTAGRVLGAGILTLAVTGILLLAGAGIASARPASTSACQAINSTLTSFTARFKAHRGTLQEAVVFLASQLPQAASTGSPALKKAVSTFIADLVAGTASGNFKDPRFTADGDAMEAACAAQAVAPRGAPATGGGSAAVVQDPALFGLGGGAVLAGIGALSLARRSRSRSGPHQGLRSHRE
jgi:hypothetical protein